MTPALILALVQTIFTGIRFIQQVWPSGEGKGAIKKEYVTGAANNLINVWTSTTTGGAKDTAEEYAPLVSAIIEAGVGLLKTDPQTGVITGLTGKDAQ